jgi:hypothetical protein
MAVILISCTGTATTSATKSELPKPTSSTSASASSSATKSPSQPAPSSTVLSSPSPKPSEVYSEPELRYRLIANYGELFYTDPDFYPVAREGAEEKNALAQFNEIRANSAEFAAIIKHLGLTDKPDYTTSEKVSIYRDHKKLMLGIQMAPIEGGYNFTLRIGESQGFRIEGSISTSGVIKETKREPSFNTRPICLSKGTMIDTPDGPVPVELLQKGAMVWTFDIAGKCTEGEVLKTSVTQVPESFHLVRVTLSDGRSVIASPGHPAQSGMALGRYSAGDSLDGAAVVGLDYVLYESGFTYDLLPSGGTGLYLANGIRLKSTLGQ